MDSSLNFYEEDIRPPDQSKRETLLQDNRSDFEKQLDEALYQSLQLYQDEVQKHEDLEQKFIQQQRQEIEKRKNLVRPILFELNRIRKYDVKIEPGIEKDSIQLNKKNEADLYITGWWTPKTNLETGIAKVFTEIKKNYGY